jgi:hypothetical protein
MADDEDLEAALFAEFSIALLDAFVPIDVQRRIPGVRAHWRALVADPDPAADLRAAYQHLTRERRSVGDAVLQALAAQYMPVRRLATGLYRRVADDQALIARFVGRVVTDGNEECPYWHGDAYTKAPAPHMLL